MKKISAGYLTSLALLIALPAWAERQVALSPASAPPSVPAKPATSSKQSIKQAAQGAYPRSHYQQALYYKQRGDFNSALVEFLRTTQEDPRMVKAYYEQAVLLWQKGYLRLAQSALEQALAVQPNYQQARLLLATISLEQGNINAAVHELSRSLGISDKKTKAESVIATPEPAEPTKLLPLPSTPSAPVAAANTAAEANAGSQNSGIIVSQSQANDDEDLNNILRGIPGIDPDVPATTAPKPEIAAPLQAKAVSAESPPPAVSQTATPAVVAGNAAAEDNSLPQAFSRAFGWFAQKRPHLKEVKPRLVKVLKRSSQRPDNASEPKSSFWSRWFAPRTQADSLAASPAEPPAPLKFKVPKDSPSSVTAHNKQSPPEPEANADLEKLVTPEISYSVSPAASAKSNEPKAVEPRPENPSESNQPPAAPKPVSTLIYSAAKAETPLPQPPPKISQIRSETFKAPALAKTDLLRPIKTNSVSKVQAVKPATQLPPQPGDQWTTRLKYLAENGTASLKPGEAFMFSEETGEASLFLPQGQVVRRFVAPPRNRQDVALQRRPDTLAPPEMMYNLSLLGKLLPKQSEPAPQTSAPEESPSLQELLSKPDGVWDWLKDRLRM